MGSLPTLHFSIEFSWSLNKSRRRRWENVLQPSTKLEHECLNIVSTFIENISCLGKSFHNFSNHCYRFPRINTPFQFFWNHETWKNQWNYFKLFSYLTVEVEMPPAESCIVGLFHSPRRSLGKLIKTQIRNKLQKDGTALMVWIEHPYLADQNDRK